VGLVSDAAADHSGGEEALSHCADHAAFQGHPGLVGDSARGTHRIAGWVF